MYGEIFGRPYLSCLQRDWSAFYFNNSGIWRASWYIICSYKMYTTEFIQGKQGLRWTRTEYSYWLLQFLLICKPIAILLNNYFSILYSYLKNFAWEDQSNNHCYIRHISLGTLVPNRRDRQGKPWLPKKQKTALKTILQ